tara:strand:- start:10 stop:231 length:222 start_codon:yes stop_codon:yes gene_type:complete
LRYPCIKGKTKNRKSNIVLILFFNYLWDMKKQIKKSRPVYIEDDIYNEQVKKADKMGLSFSSFVKMLLVNNKG